MKVFYFDFANNVENKRFRFSPEDSLRDRICFTALQYLGSPSTRYQGADKGTSVDVGFDCSGFVRFVLMESGIEIPKFYIHEEESGTIRHANEFFDHFGVLVHWGQHRKGDLVFFSKKGQVPKHVGIVLDSESYVHAPGRSGTVVCISELEQSPIISEGEDVLYNINPIGFKRPTVSMHSSDVRWHQRQI